MMEFRDWQGKAVVDRDGKKVGNIGQLYVDDRRNEPAWATVRTGLFGTKENFFPVSLAHPEGDEIHIDMPADDVKSAPAIEADRDINADEEMELYSYYQEKWGIHSSEEQVSDDMARDNQQGNERDDLRDTDMNNIDTSGNQADTPMGPVSDTTDIHDMAARGPDNTVESGKGGKRVHLRRYTVTELLTDDGQVQHKEVVIERQPVDETNADTSLNQDTKKRPLHGDERPRDTRGDSDF